MISQLDVLWCLVWYWLATLQRSCKLCNPMLQEQTARCTSRGPDFDLGHPTGLPEVWNTMQWKASEHSEWKSWSWHLRSVSNPATQKPLPSIASQSLPSFPPNSSAFNPMCEVFSYGLYGLKAQGLTFATHSSRGHAACNCLTSCWNILQLELAVNVCWRKSWGPINWKTWGSFPGTAVSD